ncbi:MAG: glutathione S-transferase family protein [Spongiibacteraceae bacterium]
MKLYTYNRAPNPRRLNLYIAYKGLTIPTQQVDLQQQQARSPAYLSRNPRGVVPALELEDGSILNDALAIALYLEAVFPHKPLFGDDGLERARIISWDQYLFTDGFGAVAEILRNGNPAFANRPLPGPLDLPQIPALVERGKLRLGGFFDYVDSQLKGREYLVGNALSWADICLLVTVDFAGWVKIGIPERCEDLRAWYKHVQTELAPLEQ